MSATPAEPPAAPSYWHKLPRLPYQWITIPQLLRRQAHRKPRDEAYVVRRRGQPRAAITFGELWTRATALAGGLRRLGLRPGDRVMVVGITSIEYLLADMACACLGVPTLRCPMHVLTRDGLVDIVNRYSIRALFFHPGENDELGSHLKTVLPAVFAGEGRSGDIPGLDFVISMTSSDQQGVLSLDQIPLSDEDEEPLPDPQPEDILTIYLSSGSTGRPKAVPHTHFALINTFLMWTLKEDSRVFYERSLAWMGASVYSPIINAICNVYVQPLTKAKDQDVLYSTQVIQEEKCNGGLFLPYLLLDLLDGMESGQIPSLSFDFISTGGDVVNADLCRRMSKYTREIQLGYGSTELMGVSKSLREDPLDVICTNAGHVAEGVEVKVVDGRGVPVPFGERGEVVVRSALTFQGYLGEEEGRGMRKDGAGWVWSGDAGSLSAEGYVSVAGRMETLISRGTLLVTPTAVEEVLRGCPGVARASAFGVPDRRLGQNVAAAVIAQAGAELSPELLRRHFDEAYVTEEGLGITPAYFLILEELPTVNGKLNRKELERMAVEKFDITA